jgi:hypothetical protein
MTSGATARSCPSVPPLSRANPGVTGPPPTALVAQRRDIDREDYGLVWNVQLETGGPYLGTRVHVTLPIEAVRQG